MLRVVLRRPEMSIELNPSRVQLDLTVEQAELLRECLFNQAELDGGLRNKILALHEQVMGALSEMNQPRN
jgi:hypothetical protein